MDRANGQSSFVVVVKMDWPIEEMFWKSFPPDLHSCHLGIRWSAKRPSAERKAAQSPLPTNIFLPNFSPLIMVKPPIIYRQMHPLFWFLRNIDLSFVFLPQGSSVLLFLLFNQVYLVSRSPFVGQVLFGKFGDTLGSRPSAICQFGVQKSNFLSQFLDLNLENSIVLGKSLVQLRLLEFIRNCQLGNSL